jgi:hypothetical protein
VRKTREEGHALRNDCLQVGDVEGVAKARQQLRHGVGRTSLEIIDIEARTLVVVVIVAITAQLVREGCDNA